MAPDTTRNSAHLDGKEDRVRELCDRAGELAGESDARRALHQWLIEFVQLGATATGNRRPCSAWPIKAAADIGVAMGEAGSDLALDSAGAVVIRGDLTAIPAAVALSRRALRVIIANLVIAASFITVLAAWDLLGHLPLPLGILGHEGFTVVVGLNGLRLLRPAAWRRGARQPA